MAQKGKGMIIFLNVGTDAVPDYQAVAGQRDFTRTRSAATIDAGDKLSSTRKQLQGDKTETFALAGLYVPDDICYQKLDLAYQMGTLVLLRAYNLGNAIWECLCSITNLSEAHPDGDVSTINIEMVPSSDVINLV